MIREVRLGSTPFAVVDLETTAIYATRHDRVIEVGVVTPSRVALSPAPIGGRLRESGGHARPVPLDGRRLLGADVTVQRAHRGRSESTSS